MNQSSDVKEKYIINFTCKHTRSANQTKAEKRFINTKYKNIFTGPKIMADFVFKSMQFANIYTLKEIYPSIFTLAK